MINKNKKLISTLLIILVILPAVLFSKPKEAHAQWYVLDGTNAILNAITGAEQTIDTGHVVTNALLAIAKQAIMVIERRLLQEMTKGVTNWINSGFHGSPLFLTNSDSFFKDIAKSEIKTIVDRYGYDTNRFPFGQQFALNTINSYKRAADADTAYSLSAIMNPQMANNYRNNFNVGGWNGFLINTQYPQNNYLGFQMLATDQLARQLAGTTQNAAQKVQTTLQQGMGFLSPQKCPTNPSYNNGLNEFQRPSYQPLAYDPPSPVFAASLNSNGNVDAIDINGNLTAAVSNQAQIDDYNTKWQQQNNTAKAAWSENNTCPGGLVSTTPGAVAANQVFKALGSDFETSALGSTVEGSLSAILNTLVSHFLDQGLNALGSAINGSSSTIDSWSYQGNTLVSSSSTTGNINGNTALTINPSSVSVIPGQAVNSITISGGTPPYYLIGSCNNNGSGSITQTKYSDCHGNWNPTDPQFAQLTANADGSITIIGVEAGNTSATIADSSGKTINLPITITPNSTPPLTTTPPATDNTIGDCDIGAAQPVHGTTKSNCDALKGVWSPTSNTGTGTGPLGICVVLGFPPSNPITQSSCNTQSNNTGMWSPLGACTQADGTITNTTKTDCSTGKWSANQ